MDRIKITQYWPDGTTASGLHINWILNAERTMELIPKDGRLDIELADESSWIFVDGSK